MTNCLITTLKGEVNDSNIPKFGYYKAGIDVRMDKNNIGYLTSSTLVGVPFRFIADTEGDGAYFTIFSSPTRLESIDTTDWGININCESDTFIDIDVYNSTLLWGILDIDETPGSESIVSIDLKQYSENSSKGSIENIGNKYKNLMAFYCTWIANVTGDIATGFGKCTKLVHVLASNSGLSGELRALGNALKENGREDGTVLKFVCNDNITLDGVSLGNVTKYINFHDGSFTIDDSAQE